MAKKVILFIGFFATLLLPDGSALRAQEWSPAQQEVWAAVQDLWRLSGALDFDPWFERVADDYRGWAVTDDTPRGKAQWREEAQERLNRPRRIHHQIIPRAIDIHGDMAIVFYRYAALSRSDEGAYSLSKGQWTDTFRKEGSRWLLVADAGGETSFHPDMLVSPEWLDRRRGDPNLVILQIESRSDAYDEGHIPGALPLPLDAIAWDGANGEGTEILPLEEIAANLEALGVSDGDQIVVYSSNSLLATRLWFTLDVMGAGRTISLLDGGLSAWNAESRPLSTEIPGPQIPGMLTLWSRPDVVVDTDWIQANGQADGIALVDARPGSAYRGEGEGTERLGHIPGAGNAPNDDMVESRELFRFRPVEELAANMADAGASPGDTVVTYCVVGLRASMDYFVARLLGYDTLLYDGSWRDWTQRGLPLVEGGG